MATEVVLQVAILVLTLSIFYVMHNLRRQAPQTRVRIKNRETHHSNRHLTQGSRLLARARSNSHRAQSLSQAKTALVEADEALSLSPRDPRAHILKASALEIMGHNAAALKCLDLALSSPHAKSLSVVEREEALVKRAEFKLAVNRRRRVDSAVKDLIEAVSLTEVNNSNALCLLGECYEWRGLKEKAQEAFQRALDVDPHSCRARNGLDRLGP